MILDSKLLAIFISREAAWIRLGSRSNNVLLHLASHKPLYSERNGYVKSYPLIGKWRLLVRRTK